MNRFTWFLAVGGVIGGALATWLAPNIISWYFDPPAGFGVSCKEPIVWALKRLQYAQLAGIAFGALLSVLLFFRFRTKKDPNEQTLPQ